MKITREDVLNGIALCHELEKVWDCGSNAAPRRNRQQRTSKLRKLLEELLQVDSTTVNATKINCVSDAEK